LTLEALQPVMIEGDPELLTQMVLNLTENALRHTPPGTAVRVTVSRRNGQAQLEVCDNGPGVPDQERERLFDRFYRLERSRSTPGSGLGLALSAAVARLHEAKVDLSDARPGLRATIAFSA
jgi:signal transduction histidine kinase